MVLDIAVILAVAFCIFAFGALCGVVIQSIAMNRTTSPRNKRISRRAEKELAAMNQDYLNTHSAMLQEALRHNMGRKAL